MRRGTANVARALYVGFCFLLVGLAAAACVYSESKVEAQEKPRPCSFATDKNSLAGGGPLPSCSAAGCLVCVPQYGRAQCYWIDAPELCPR